MWKYNYYFVILTLMLSEYPSKTRAFRTFKEDGTEIILALENEKVVIGCSSDMPMGYCGFIHPNGTRYSFTGLDTNYGKCAIKISASKNDAGIWRCHIGGKTAGVEQLKAIKLRVVNPMAAVKSNITAVHGKSVTLFCTTTRGLVPLKYCRFEPPKDSPFSIDSTATEANPLLKRFYFPANKSLDRGDCAVTIRKVKYEDVGKWTCCAGLDDGKEYTDVIKFEVEGLYTMSTASATGITFGALGIIAFLSILGIVAWKKRNLLGSVQPDVSAESHELEQLPSRPTPSPQATPHRSLPAVTIESPSEQSEPGTTSPLVQQVEE
ncbi:uncharacterized protein LOC142974340 [Anticarsia gemmatalis]|uniref:uncharacterized protein LOC142974340 n=1 Tax=Anticarsia gemmatalis TaxID=129554 RepID=UPI003F772308